MTGWLRETGQKALLPPLALATLAALVPPDYDVEIVDEEVRPLDFDTPCDLVGITGYTNHASRMFAIAAEFRKRGVLTVGGGSYVTIDPERCRPHFDVLVCGEAERVWPQFLEDWERGGWQTLYRGESDLDLSLSPLPRWDLVDLRPYTTAIVQTSRGCPYDCEFCDVVALFGNRMRYKPVEQILREVEDVARRSRKSIFLADDNLIGNKRFIKALLRELIALNGRLPSPVSFATQLTLNVAQDAELLDLFKRANFFMFFIGVETPREASLVETNKKHNLLMDMVEAVRRIQSRGIYIVSGLVVGFDSDDASVFRQQSRFLMQAGLTAPMLATLKAPRGTALWRRLEAEGRLIDGEACDTFGDYACNFIPKNMSREELEDNYLRLFRRVYSYSHFLRRFRTLVGQLDPREIATHSPLTWRMRRRRWRDYSLAVLFMMLRFLWLGGRRDRRFFLLLIHHARRKGWAACHLIYETLVFFISQRRFVESLVRQRTLSFHVRRDRNGRRGTRAGETGQEPSPASEGGVLRDTQASTETVPVNSRITTRSPG